MNFRNKQKAEVCAAALAYIAKNNYIGIDFNFFD